MSIDIERGLLARYAARVLVEPCLPLSAAKSILGWFKDRGDLKEFAPPAKLAKALRKSRKEAGSTPLFERAFTEARTDYLGQILKIARHAPEPEPVRTNIEHVVRAFSLPADASELLLLCAQHDRSHLIDSFACRLKAAVGGISHPIALLTDIDRRRVEHLVSPAGDLAAKGIIALDREGCDLVGQYGRIRQSSRIDAHLDTAFGSGIELKAALLGDPVQSDLEFEDFEHVHTQRTLLRRVLAGAGKVAPRGVNILLYGPPGSGKTELAKVTAHAAGLTLYTAGEAIGERELSRKDRLKDLMFTEQLLSGARGSAILFDELEDVAVDLFGRGGSKLYVNRLLEQNAVPVIWTSNNIETIDPAIIRRMTLAIELKRPPRAQRARMWNKTADRLGVKLTEQDCAALGRRVGGEPSVIYNATLAAKLAGGGRKTAEHVAKDLLWALDHKDGASPRNIVKFDPALAPADTDLVYLTEHLTASKSAQFSLCLSGPPGAGKSAYAHHLASVLGLEMMQMRASDLLDMYVGQTEQRIAAAFRDAAEQGAFLFFDEADSLLTDRRDAFRSWEISQVNEMLTWMEHHPLPFCCATNLADRLDAAAMRRFVFHVRFEFLSSDGIEKAWRLFFGRAAPKDTLSLGNLTPGDFAQVKRRADVLGQSGDNSALAPMFHDISRGKPGVGRQIGFVRK